MNGGSKKITRLFELEVYKKSFAAAMRIFELSKDFPVEEKYSLTDQIRRSSRSVCANEAEAWRKRIYPAHFASKLNDSEAEAAETQTWLQFACKCKYLKLVRKSDQRNLWSAVAWNRFGSLSIGALSAGLPKR